MEQEEKKELEQLQGRDSDSSSQEGQKNERQEPEPKLKKELTEEEKLKRNKMMVLGAAVIGMVVIAVSIPRCLTLTRAVLALPTRAKPMRWTA